MLSLWAFLFAGIWKEGRHCQECEVLNFNFGRLEDNNRCPTRRLSVGSSSEEIETKGLRDK
jgi:hypothetical protein